LKEKQLNCESRGNEKCLKSTKKKERDEERGKNLVKVFYLRKAGGKTKNERRVTNGYSMVGTGAVIRKIKRVEKWGSKKYSTEFTF